jgi:hypothetical protein
VKAISNAGPLIALAKLGQLGLNLKLFDEIVIPREVYTEVVTNGLLLGAWDAGSVDFLARQGHIFVKDVNLPTPIPARGNGSRITDGGELSPWCACSG